MPFLTNTLLSFGRLRPFTFTSVRPACSTASAAPGTDGEQIAISILQLFGGLWQLLTSSKACFCLSSHGRSATLFSLANFSSLYLPIAFSQSTIFPLLRY